MEKSMISYLHLFYISYILFEYLDKNLPPHNNQSEYEYS